MANAETELRNARAAGLDLRPPREILEILADGHRDALGGLDAALDAIACAAGAAADALSAGGRLAYTGAGSSGLIAMADALELPGTFGIAPEKVKILFAGGTEGLKRLTGGYEDDTVLAASDAEAAGIGRGDCVIGISASGNTPYTLTVIEIARSRGAQTVGVANNAGSALLELADIAIHLPTPPEVVAGATRMASGTAQKATLNMLSTLMAVELGHVHDGYMINVVPDNDKLRARAAGMVADITGCPPERAAELVALAGGAVKPAVLMARGAGSLEEATRLLDAAGGRLRGALAVLGSV